MIFPTQQEWDDWGIEDGLHKFFTLRWHEIFDEDTFDSWQVRSCNLSSIFNEMIVAIDTVERVHSSHHNIHILIEEAQEIAGKDKIILRYFPFIPSYLKCLKKEYNENIKPDKKKDTNEFKKILNVIIGNLSTYRNLLISDLTELITSPPQKFKHELYSLVMLLGIELKSTGYSILSLRESFNLLITPNNDTFSERFSKLIERFSGKEHDYTCHFMVSWPGSPSLNERHIELYKTRPDHEYSNEEREFYDQDLQATIAKVKVKALDSYSAKVEAEKKIQALFALNSLYSPNSTAIIKHKKALIIEENQDMKKCIGFDPSNRKYIRDARNSERSIAELWSLSEKLHSKDADRLAASLQYHKMAMESLTDEARLVNLWIAVESLVQDGGKNIIDRITRYIPSSVTISYIYSIMKAIPIDIRKIWKQLNTTSLEAKLSRSNRYILNPFDLLTILLDKKHGELITEFFSLFSDHPLLIYRMNSLWENLLNAPEMLEKQLEKHKQNIEWQLRRIYRARNYVMHKGTCPQQARQLIQHLHSYYIVTIHNLIHDLKRNSKWSINDAFEHRWHLYDYFHNELNKKQPNISAKMIFNPQLVLFKKQDASAWDNK